MKKNIINYKSFIYYRGNDGIGSPSSKEEFLKRLNSFEGMFVGYAEIKDGFKMKSQYLTFAINILNNIKNEDIEENTIAIEEKYKFSFVRQWSLYLEDKLIYEGDDFTKYGDPKKYESLFKGVKLLKTSVDNTWTKATFTFDNKLELIVKARFDKQDIMGFFIITKQAEPLRMQMNFAKPEEITYINEVLTSKVVNRKNKPGVSYDYMKIIGIAKDEGLT